jgi:hypothetical protein
MNRRFQILCTTSLIFLVLTNCKTAQAQTVELIIKKARGFGNSTRCDDNVSSISFGADSSILFGNFDLRNMKEDIKRIGNLRSRCNVRAQLIIPQGFYMTGYRNGIAYGIVKSRGVEAQIGAKLTFRGLLTHDSVPTIKTYPRKKNVNEALEILQFEEELENSYREMICAKTRRKNFAAEVTFTVDLKALHIRAVEIEPVFQVDTADIAIDLVANLKHCDMR